MLHMDGSNNGSHRTRGRAVALSPWRTVPPPLRFSMRIGCIPSAIDFRLFSSTAPGFLPGPLSPVSLKRRVHTASFSLRERRIGTDRRPTGAPLRHWRSASAEVVHFSELNAIVPQNVISRRGVEEEIGKNVVHEIRQALHAFGTATRLPCDRFIFGSIELLRFE